ncbi:MAG TPA: PepSY domain-containing protein [Pyrinomonadaceae bacterium]|nr:PepSY domain-containing protein [Pyrinomonadaceae bacterium]
MKRKLTSSVILCAVLCAGAFAATTTVWTLSGQDKNQAKLAKQARITMEQARKIALERAPGTIEEEELEKEHGKLVYSFDIRNAGGAITEVQVNAKDGSIASVEEEDAKEEAEEKRKEKHKGNSNKRPE